MHVTGATGYVRGRSRRGTGGADKAGQQSTAVTRTGGATRTGGTARGGGATWTGGSWSASHGGWHRAVGWGGWRRAVGWSGWRRVGREFLLLAVFAAAYEFIGKNMVQAGGAAASHALSVVSAERGLGLFHEQAVQALFIRWDTVTDAFNTYYGGTHFLVPALALGWLLLRHPERYARARTALAVTTAVGFVCFWLYPVAPPRLLPASFGIADTLRDAGPGHVESTLITTAGDQYASMPSLHVAWAVWCALALYPVIRHRWLRVLVAAYPVVTTLVVVATGNHFFLDALAGTLLAGLTWAVISRLDTRLSFIDTIVYRCYRITIWPGPESSGRPRKDPDDDQQRTQRADRAA
jgi:hypothetical protein